jgi:GT2 family glycosyltransferase
MSIKVSINLVVLNGEKYIRYFLDSVKKQTYPHDEIELNILDNGSTDRTKEIIRNWESEIKNSGFAIFNFIESKKNLGMWPGQEELLKHSKGKYILTTAVDIILDKNFIINSIKAMENDKRVGAIQPKIYHFNLQQTTKSDSSPHLTNTIDTCGFQIFKSRRIINIGHGEEDRGQYDNLYEIFAIEGAAPFFRKEALESCRIKFIDSNNYISEIFDHDFFWYGDDLDLGWRMRIFGWKEIFSSKVIAWHDRQTTKSLKKTGLDYVLRIPLRKKIPIQKRRLDWRNTRWTLIKNDYIINILKDLPQILFRELMVLGYEIIFEPGVLKEVPNFFRYLPKIISKRKTIMRQAKVKPSEIRKWFK